MADFYIERRIYYHHTDAGGVVYYANYLGLLEEARHEFCRQKGIDLIGYSQKGILFPVVHIEVDYKAPARYGDTVIIFTRVDKLRNASIHFLQEIKKQDLVLLVAKVVVACIDGDFKARLVPDEMRQLFLCDNRG